MEKRERKRCIKKNTGEEDKIKKREKTPTQNAIESIEENTKYLHKAQ